MSNENNNYPIAITRGQAIAYLQNERSALYEKLRNKSYTTNVTAINARITETEKEEEEIREHMIAPFITELRELMKRHYVTITCEDGDHYGSDIYSWTVEGTKCATITEMDPYHEQSKDSTSDAQGPGARFVNGGQFYGTTEEFNSLIEEAKKNNPDRNEGGNNENE